jgi:hypothetical protein
LKAIPNRIIKDEQGKVLIMALILLVVGALVLTPLLGLVSTGLIAGQVYERKTAELYAADAGVEDAVWKIRHEVDELPWPGRCGNYTTWTYPMPDINGRSLEVTIIFVDDSEGVTYRVISEATANGSGTQIEAYVSGTPPWGDYSGITEHIVCSQNESDIAKKVELVYEDEENGPMENYTGDWPTAEELILFYSRDVDKSVSYPFATLDVKDYVGTGIGPFYRDGPLDIVNTGAAGLTLQLNGTVYITGEVTIGNTNQDFYLDLNGNTIFVESSAVKPPKEALYIGGKCTTEGPGAVVAIGDIYYEPNSQTGGEDSPIFIMSVSGTTTLKPSGDFYGSVAGSVEVVIQQGTEPTLTYPTGGFGDLNWPGFVTGDLIYSIVSWKPDPL